MRSAIVALLLAVPLVACGGAQEDANTGPAFCESYEMNFLAGCQQNCEAESQVGPGDEAGIKACEKSCASSLGSDGTFADGCPERAKTLAGS